MKRSVIVLALATVGFAGCGGAEPERPTAVPDEVEMEQALELIRSCRVTSVGSTHSGEMQLTLENGRLITIAAPDSNVVWETTKEASDRCGEIEIYSQ